MGSDTFTCPTMNAFEFLSTDNLRDFMLLVDSFPTATPERNEFLLLEYRQGNLEALDLLVKTNIKLIVSVAKTYVNLAKSYKLLDLIQESVIGFINAANSYDFNRKEKAKFSTYATKCINNHIKDCLICNDSVIKRPYNIGHAVCRYNRTIIECKHNNEKPPSDDELRIRLKLTQRGLETVKNDHMFDTISLEPEDKNDNSLLNIMSNPTDLIDECIDQITQKELFVYLKRNIPAYHYYIIMMRVFTEMTCEEIGKSLGVKKQTIEQQEKRIHAYLRELCSKDRIFQYHFDTKITDDELSKMGFYPTQPSDIIKYMFFKDALTDIERKLYKLYIEGYYIRTPEVFAELLGIELIEYLNVKKSLVQKLTSLTPEMEETYAKFKALIIGTHRTKIFKIDWDMNLKDFAQEVQSTPMM